MLKDGIEKAAAKHNIAVTVNQIVGALTVYFTEDPVTNYAEAGATMVSYSDDSLKEC